jgi:hypothetical protein
VDRNARRPTTKKQDAGEAAPENSWFETFLLPYIKESTLWPVVFVVVAHAAAFLMPAILFSFRDRKLSAIAGIVILIALSLRACGSDFRRKRFGVITGLLLATWALAFVAAFFADHWQLL